MPISPAVHLRSLRADLQTAIRHRRFYEERDQTSTFLLWDTLVQGLEREIDAIPLCASCGSPSCAGTC